MENKVKASLCELSFMPQKNQEMTIDYMRGYLAAMLDGEGCVTYSNISFVNNTDETIIRRVCRFLEFFGVSYRIDVARKSKLGHFAGMTVSTSNKINASKFYLLLGDCTKRGRLYSWLSGSMRAALRRVYAEKARQFNKRHGYKRVYGSRDSNLAKRRRKYRSMSNVGWAMKRWFDSERNFTYKDFAYCANSEPKAVVEYGRREGNSL